LEEQQLRDELSELAAGIQKISTAYWSTSARHCQMQFIQHGNTSLGSTRESSQPNHVGCSLLADIPEMYYVVWCLQDGTIHGKTFTDFQSAKKEFEGRCLKGSHVMLVDSTFQKLQCQGDVKEHIDNFQTWWMSQQPITKPMAALGMHVRKGQCNSVDMVGLRVFENAVAEERGAQWSVDKLQQLEVASNAAALEALPAWQRRSNLKTSDLRECSYDVPSSSANNTLKKLMPSATGHHSGPLSHGIVVPDVGHQNFACVV